MRDHSSYLDDVGAYVLGALTDPEREAFDRHMANCPECRHEVERLRPAADSLPRSVEQLAPPAGLKTSLMEVVDREARERWGEAAPRPRRLRWPALGRARPLLVGAALALGVVVGIVVSGGDESRVEVASVDERRAPGASARLQVVGDGDGGILTVQQMPPLEAGRVYQAWIERDGAIVPQPTFEVGEDGSGAVAIPDDVSDADAVMVTREPPGGSRAPSERPLLVVSL